MEIGCRTLSCSVNTMKPLCGCIVCQPLYPCARLQLEEDVRVGVSIATAQIKTFNQFSSSQRTQVSHDTRMSSAGNSNFLQFFSSSVLLANRKMYAFILGLETMKVTTTCFSLQTDSINACACAAGNNDKFTHHTKPSFYQ